MDWFPTVLEFCGIQQPSDAPKLDGHSIIPLLRDEKAPDAYHGILHFAWRGGWTVRDGAWKLISGERWCSEERGMKLHRLTDPRPEEKDHAAEQPEIVARLHAMHQEWLEKVHPKKPLDPYEHSPFGTFLPVLSPFAINALIAFFAKTRASQIVLLCTTIAYAVWAFSLYLDVQSSSDGQAGFALLLTAIAASPVLLIAWIACLVIEIIQRKRGLGHEG